MPAKRLKSDPSCLIAETTNEEYRAELQSYISRASHAKRATVESSAGVKTEIEALRTRALPEQVYTPVIPRSELLNAVAKDDVLKDVLLQLAGWYDTAL